MASRPKMFPTRLALQCNDIVVQSLSLHFIWTNDNEQQKGFILLIFSIVISHHFYKHSNHCCDTWNWKQSTLAPEVFFPRRQEGLRSCHQFHCVHWDFLSSSVLSSRLLVSVYYMCFKKVIKRVDALKNGATFVLYKTSGNACKMHPDPPSVLSAIKQD